MKSRVVRTLLLPVQFAIVASGTACGSTYTTETPTPVPTVGSNSQQAPGRSVRADEDFDLRAGESARLVDTTLVLRVDAVEADSRCPVDVTCVWAGDAVVRVIVELSSGPAETVQLHTNETLIREATVGQYRIRLMKLAPSRRSDSEIDQSAYIATLRISRD